MGEWFLVIQRISLSVSLPTPYLFILFIAQFVLNLFNVSERAARLGMFTGFIVPVSISRSYENNTIRLIFYLPNIKAKRHLRMKGFKIARRIRTTKKGSPKYTCGNFSNKSSKNIVFLYIIYKYVLLRSYHFLPTHD